MTEPIAQIIDLTQRYEGVERPVLEGVNLSVAPGDSVAIVGPSGSGKSTLLHVMGCLLPPTEGTVLIDGTDVGALSADQLARLRNERIGFVFQAHHLLPQCTALENVLVPTLVAAMPKAAAADRGRRLLEAVGLGHRVDHRPSALSGGECQRVAIVRALINGPGLVLADEPTGALDSTSSRQLADLFSDLREREGVAVVTVTHSMDLAARMERVLELRDGRLTERERTS